MTTISDLVTRLRAEIDPEVNESIDRLLGEAAERIAHLELALVELSLTSGSPRNVANTELLASRVRASARRALRPQPSPDKLNKAFEQATTC